MSRRPPPQPPSTALITREGFERLRAELDDLWRVQRPEVVRALAAAAAEGDRSENAEYIYRKKQLGGIDRRVRFLGKRIPELRVVETVPTDRTAIFFGAQVTVARGDTGERAHYRVVGPDETDAARGYISIDSPLARALLGKRANDEVTAGLPDGPVTFGVVGVDYDASIARHT